MVLVDYVRIYIWTLKLLANRRYPEIFSYFSGIRELPRFRKIINSLGYWRKHKGFATVRMPDGSLRETEIHGYETTVIGKREFNIKRYTNIQP